MTDVVNDKEFLETIVKSIVNKPEAVSVEREVDEMGVLLTLKVDPEEMGSIIGRKGQTAQAMRTLLKIVGAKNNSRVNLKIYDPNSTDDNRRERKTVETKKDEVDTDTSVIDDLKI